MLIFCISLYEIYQKTGEKLLTFGTSLIVCIVHMAVHVLFSGNTISHIRDCSDGIHFSFIKDKKTGTYKRLTDLIPNNETACVWDGLHQVCLSQCNTDFCNGPQLEEQNSALWIQSSKPVILLFFVFITNCKNYFY